MSPGLSAGVGQVHRSPRSSAAALTHPGERSKFFRRGSRVNDDRALGYTDEGDYLLDTTASGNSNSGHDYGTGLAPQEKADLIEYLKTL